MGDYPGPRPGPCTITLVRERQEGQRRGVAMGAEARVTQCGFEDRRGLRAKEYRQPLEAGEGKRQILPPSLRKEHSPAHTLVSAQTDPGCEIGTLGCVSHETPSNLSPQQQVQVLFPLCSDRNVGSEGESFAQGHATPGAVELGRCHPRRRAVWPG